MHPFPPPPPPHFYFKSASVGSVVFSCINLSVVRIHLLKQFPPVHFLLVHVEAESLRFVRLSIGKI